MSLPEVLIVSTDADNAAEIVRVLHQAGIPTLICRDPTRVREALAQRRGGMLLLDLELPGLDRASLAKAFVPQGSGVEPLSLRDLERRHIYSVLRYTHGNKRRAAQILGIARSTLIQKVRRFELDDAGSSTA